MAGNPRQLDDVRKELAEVERRRNELREELARLSMLPPQPELPLTGFEVADSAIPAYEAVVVTQHSSEAAKIALFRALFRGREDVFPKRFESQTTGKSGYQPCCRNEWQRGICEKPRIRCADCEHRQFVPVTDEVIRAHLTGHAADDWHQTDFVAGVYPLLADETCWFVAADFDKATWQQDVGAFRDTCHFLDVPVAVERSRSGNGAHAWIFFTAPVPALKARKLATVVLTQTISRRPELGLDSYDRFFPNQDTMPKGGFGNLIALPLQKKPRVAGNSVFVDGAWTPYPDQWDYLSGIRRINEEKLDELLCGWASPEQELGLSGDAGTIPAQTAPWLRTPSGRVAEPIYNGPKPDKVTLVSANQVYIPKEGLPPPLRTQLIRLAAFPNPEFYQAQALRFPVHKIPRVISCHEDLPEHLGLPRGLLEPCQELFHRWDIATELQNERTAGRRLKVSFNGELRPEQKEALKQILAHDTGVLAASTAFGKTVIAAKVIASRKVNTLVLVHSRQLLDQWIERLGTFLAVPAKSTGQIRGGKDKPTGMIDVATLQSLIRDGVVDDRVANYGQVIVDECHHISARTFEQIAKQCRATFVLGLSATVKRKDGHHPIIFMQCGPVRFEVTDREAAAQRPFDHIVIPRFTEFAMPPGKDDKAPVYSVHQVFQAVVACEPRNRMIVEDVMAALAAGRRPVVLTERVEHLNRLATLLKEQNVQVCVLRGGLGTKAKRQSLSIYNDNASGVKYRVLLATGRYLGEGFDDERLDTLFLVFPVSWRGTLTQYAGRLHRQSTGKERVIIYDYADMRDPVLTAMFRRRCTGYRTIGYEIAGL